MDAGCLPGLVWPTAATGAESPSLTEREAEGAAVEECSNMMQHNYDLFQMSLEPKKVRDFLISLGFNIHVMF